MAKKIVLCTDGTWEKMSNNTNVWRIYNAIKQDATQVAFYDDGVGADGGHVEMGVEGAFGLGLFEKVKQAYTQAAHVYEAGDEIFIFGFSRGAFTARSVAGMIAVCGLPTKNFDNNQVDLAFEAYRNKLRRDDLLKQLKQEYAMEDVNITMLGVWDTVGALGIPSVIGGVDPIVYGFLDTTLHPDVKHAYHAVAIDEKRAEFPATLWTGAPVGAQVMEQVWFCGCHGDVGGGVSPNASGTALSDITLSWMIGKACALGLKIDPAIQKSYSVPLDAKYALDDLHPSWSILWGFPRLRTIAHGSCLADSVVVRLQSHDNWTPKNVMLENGLPSSVSYTITPVLTAVLAAAAAGGAPPLQ